LIVEVEKKKRKNFNEAVKNGMRLDLEDIKKLDDSYKKDYTNHLWKENDEVITDIYKTRDAIL
jgi:hypothetical protein